MQAEEALASVLPITIQSVVVAPVTPLKSKPTKAVLPVFPSTKTLEIIGAKQSCRYNAAIVLLVEVLPLLFILQLSIERLMILARLMALSAVALVHDEPTVILFSVRFCTGDAVVPVTSMPRLAAAKIVRLSSAIFWQPEATLKPVVLKLRNTPLIMVTFVNPVAMEIPVVAVALLVMVYPCKLRVTFELVIAIAVPVPVKLMFCKRQ